MELGVNDYVRTPLGITKYIGKYDNYEGFYEFDKLDEELWTGDIANVVYSCEIDNIVLKSSPNIIDLIEVGDYVNGKRVEWIGYDLYRENEDKTLTGIGEKRILFNEFTKDSVREKGIKSIATHEQFSQMEYKVGD